MATKIQAIVCLTIVCVAICATSALAVNNGDIPVNTAASARRMIEDLNTTYGEKYRGGKEFLRRLGSIEARLKANGSDASAHADLQTLIREAALANPLLDVDKILVVRRKGEANRSLNAHTTATVRLKGWDNEISELSNLRGKLKVRTVYRHTDQSVMKHLDLHFGGRRVMFSGLGKKGQWAVLDVDMQGKGLRELTPSAKGDVQWFDGCYLPKPGYIIAASTASAQGLPCENGKKPMVNLYRVDTKAGKARQLTFEQDSD